MSKFEENLIKSRKAMGKVVEWDKTFGYRPTGFPVMRAEDTKRFYLQKCREEHPFCSCECCKGKERCN